MSATATSTTPSITLLMFPTGMAVTTFSALTDLLSTALGEDAEVVLRAPAGLNENSAVVVNNLSEQQISRRLRAAAAAIDGAPRAEDPDAGGPSMILGSPISFTGGGVDISVGFDDANREDGQALLGAIAKALTESFEDNSDAINYLQLAWHDIADPRVMYRLIGVKPGQPTPHDLRVAADAECARLRALLIAHEIDPDAPLESAR